MDRQRVLVAVSWILVIESLALAVLLQITDLVPGAGRQLVDLFGSGFLALLLAVVGIGITGWGAR